MPGWSPVRFLWLTENGDPDLTREDKGFDEEADIISK